MPRCKRRPVRLLIMIACLSWAAHARAQVGEPGMDKDMETVKARLREALIPTTARTVESATQAARGYAASLQADGSWPDVDYSDRTPGPWKTSQHLARVATLARAYQIPNQPLYHAADLKARTLLALDYWLQHDFRNPNWWHNQIGVPQTMGDTLVLLEQDVTLDELKRGAAIMARSSWTDEAGKPVHWTGANLVWIASNRVVLGCLTHDAAVVAEAFARIFDEIRVERQGQEGIQADESFHQHGDVLYAGGYGAAFTGETTSFVDYARGTRFAATPEKLQILTNFVLDGQQWMIRGGVWDYGVTGREITRAGKDARSLAGAVERLARLPQPRRQELLAFAARLRGEAAAPPLSGNRSYWKSDFMVHQRPAYYSSARMFSTRTLNTDGYINSEGKKSHHIADGANFVMRSGEEYRDIFPVWDWRRVPGTTVEQQPEPLQPKGMQTRGKTGFVGGASDGTYGLAAMDLARDGLTAKKAWFFFDNEYVCLGAGINCATENPVLTSINQCLLHGPVETSLGNAPLEPGERTLADVAWVLHDRIGYVFPGHAAVHLKNQAQSGSWADIGAGSATTVTKDVFSLWLDHGAHVANGGYAYIVVPDTDRRSLAARENHVAIVSNTPALQAVRHDGLHLLAIAFWQAGRCTAAPGWSVAVDQPCLLLMRETGGGVQFALSNPENKPLSVNVTIDRTLQGDGAAAANGQTQVHFDLPGGEQAGSSLVRQFKSP